MRKQFTRYAVVGLGSNAILYLAYLLVTGIGIGHKTSMTLLYGVGILLTFLLNRRWTFGHQGNFHSAFYRYLIIYLLGYLLNFFGLYIFVDALGSPHQLIQGILIILIAMFLFALQRLWVFNERNERPEYIPKQSIS